MFILNIVIYGKVSLDTYVENPLIMMQVVEEDILDPAVENEYISRIKKHFSYEKSIERIERFEFYERTKSAFAVVITGETAKYENIIIKKGFLPC